MRISDWSSDVCSSDLSAVDVLQQQAVASGQFIRDPVREASVGRKLCIAEFGILIAYNSIALDTAEQPPLRRLRRANVRLLLAFSLRAHDVAHEPRALRRAPYAPARQSVGAGKSVSGRVNLG